MTSRVYTPKSNTINLELEFGILGTLSCDVTYFASPAEKGSSEEPPVDEEFTIEKVIAEMPYRSGNGGRSFHFVDITKLFDKESDDQIKDAIKEYHDDY
jgi:hypothetical protein